MTKATEMSSEHPWYRSGQRAKVTKILWFRMCTTQGQCQTETESKLSVFQCVQNSKQDCQLQDNSLKVWSIRSWHGSVGKYLPIVYVQNFGLFHPPEYRELQSSQTWMTSKIVLYFYQDISFVEKCHVFSYSPIIVIRDWQACVLWRGQYKHFQLCGPCCQGWNMKAGTDQSINVLICVPKVVI